MKKALVLLLAALMVMALSAPSFAVPIINPGYIQSEEMKSDVEDPGNKKGINVLPIDSDDIDQPTKDKIDDAIKEIQDADDITKLNEDVKDIIDKYYDDLDAEDFAAEDIFVIKIDEDAQPDEDGYYDVNVNIHYTDDDETPIFFIKGDDGKWVPIDPSNVIRNADNTFTLRVTGSGLVVTFSPIRTPVKKGGETEKGTGSTSGTTTKTSPQTGAQNTILAVVAVSVAVCLAGVVVFVNAKRKAENN